ncbi:MAG TPA: hypothetical protein VIL60_09395 [Rhodanobacter sp.]
MNRRHRRQIADRIILMLGALLLPVGAMAADAHMAVKAKPGDIVLLRNLATRPAYRPAPPGIALMVDPSPRHELSRALGTTELSDDEYASLGATPVQSGHHVTVVGQMVDNALGGTLGGGNGRMGAPSNGVSNLISGPLGTVGNTTRGIGDQVRGALTALPGMTTPTAPTGH